MNTRDKMQIGELRVEEKFGVHGTDPVGQSAKIADPAAGATVDAE